MSHEGTTDLRNQIVQLGQSGRYSKLLRLREMCVCGYVYVCALFSTSGFNK